MVVIILMANVFLAIVNFICRKRDYVGAPIEMAKDSRPFTYTAETL